MGSTALALHAALSAVVPSLSTRGGAGIAPMPEDGVRALSLLSTTPSFTNASADNGCDSATMLHRVRHLAFPHAASMPSVQLDVQLAEFEAALHAGDIRSASIAAQHVRVLWPSSQTHFHVDSASRRAAPMWTGDGHMVHILMGMDVNRAVCVCMLCMCRRMWNVS
jgi:hypothetical protein